MNIKKFLLVSISFYQYLLVSFLFLLISINFYKFLSVSNSNPGQISGIATKSSSVSVDAFIGEYMFTLFGYSSPNALVTIDGMGIYDQTYAGKTGYFEFNNRFSPQSPREACLTAQDQFGRITSPTCIPPFPTKYNVRIGPVLLPPTVSLNAQNYYQGDEVKLSGQAVPNTELTFSAFIDEKKSIFSFLASRLIKPVYALTFPRLTSKSDEKGNFSLSLPSARPETFRLFAQTSYENSQSPESVKLDVKIYPIWMIIIHFFLFLFSLIKSRLLEIIILGEIIVLVIFFLRRYLHPHVIARSRSLAMRTELSLMKND